VEVRCSLTRLRSLILLRTSITPGMIDCGETRRLSHSRFARSGFFVHPSFRDRGRNRTQVLLDGAFHSDACLWDLQHPGCSFCLCVTWTVWFQITGACWYLDPVVWLPPALLISVRNSGGPSHFLCRYLCSKPMSETDDQSYSRRATKGLRACRTNDVRIGKSQLDLVCCLTNNLRLSQVLENSSLVRRRQRRLQHESISATWQA